MIQFGLGRVVMERTPAQHCQCLCLPVRRVTTPGCAPGPSAVAQTQRGSEDTLPRSCRYRDIICPLSCPRLCMQPMALWLLHFQKRGQKNLQNIFGESLRVIPSPLSAVPGCLIKPNYSMLSSFLAPRYTKKHRPLLQMFRKGVVLGASHPTSKYDQFGLLFFQSLTNLFTVSRKDDDSIGFSLKSLDRQSLDKGCL